MMKKHLRAYALLLLALLLVAAPALAQVTLTPMLEGIGSIRYVQGTNYLILWSKETGCGVYSTQGTELIPFGYNTLQHVGHGYFLASTHIGLDIDRHYALLNTQGEAITDWKYGAFEVLSDRWCVALVMEPTEGEPYDHSFDPFTDQALYNIVRYDVYDLQTGAMLGSLERDAYESARAHGEYLYVKDREGGMTVYDKTLTPLNVVVDSVNNAYAVVDGLAVCLSDGSVLCARALFVADDPESGTVLVYHSDGSAVLYAMDGTPLVPAGFDLISPHVYGDYALVMQDGLSGLYDIQNGRLAVPCEYDKVHVAHIGPTSSYVSNGYACVEKNGKLGFVDMQGNVTCEIKYPVDTATLHGASITIPGTKGWLYLIAADGVQSRLNFDKADKEHGGDGTLLVVRKGERYGIVDWHGEVVLPPEFTEYDLEITDCADAVIVDDTVMRVDRK